MRDGQFQFLFGSRGFRKRRRVRARVSADSTLDVFPKGKKIPAQVYRRYNNDYTNEHENMKRFNTVKHVYGLTRFYTFTCLL